MFGDLGKRRDFVLEIIVNANRYPTASKLCIITRRYFGTILLDTNVDQFL